MWGKKDLTRVFYKPSLEGKKEKKGSGLIR